jgi:hypothetical protein
MKLPLCLLVLLFPLSDAFGQSAPTFPRPYGIYAIGQSSVSNIRDYPYVDGFVMRVDWALLEPQRGLYDFSLIDAVVRKLDTLGQKLTLDVFRMRTPSYIMSTPGVQTHVLRLSRDSFYTAVPWDSIALNRFDLLHEALASHRIRSMRDGAELPLRDHPVLKQIDATPIGTNGIRDLNHSLTSHPTYTRAVFIEAILRTAEMVRKHFPKTYCFVALFGIRDSITSPVLTDVLRDSLLRRINTVPGRPMLGFFQENLACSGPVTNPGNPLFAARDSTFTMYQMLQSWQQPFRDSTKTNVCKTDSTGPDVAMLKALSATHGMYFELYVSDLDFPGYSAMFQRMHDSLAVLNGVQTSIDRIRNAPQPRGIDLQGNFPNPVSTSTTVVYRVAAPYGMEAGSTTLKIYDILGRCVLVQTLPANTQGTHALPIDASALTPGMYLMRIVGGAVSAERPLLIIR